MTVLPGKGRRGTNLGPTVKRTMALEGMDGGMGLAWGVFAVAVDGSLQIPVWIDLTGGVGSHCHRWRFLCECVPPRHTVGISFVSQRLSQRLLLQKSSVFWQCRVSTK